MRFVFGILLIFAIPIMYVVALSFQDPQSIEGTIQQKFYQEEECKQEPTYDPALNTYLPKENCKGPTWTITINDEQYQVSEILYNKLEIGSFYSFSYHPLEGISLLQ